MAVKAQNVAVRKSGIDSIMRSDGRIYVVVAVMLLILTGLIIYVFRVDRKIGRIEREPG